MFFRTFGISILTALVCLCLVSLGQAGTVSGIVYHDQNRNSQSHYEQPLDENDSFLPDLDVYLINGTDEWHQVTAADGGFSFDEVAPGTYLLEFGLDSSYECTSVNRSYRVAEALREGAIHTVTIGDSIGNTGSDVPYPERLTNRFNEMVIATLDNVSVGGSASWEWLPGAEKAYFEDRLLPVLPDADLLTITLGGNDLYPYTIGMPPYDPWQIILNFFEHPEYLFGILPNLVDLVDAVRDVNPDCDIVYVIYPNFAHSEMWLNLLGEPLRTLGEFALDVGMPLARWTINNLHPIILGDMYGALGDTVLDPYLFDEIHPNDEGHQLYADVIFVSLGGVVIEEKDMGEEHSIGFFAPDLVPVDDDTVDDDVIDDDTVDDDIIDDDAIDDDAVDDDAADDDAVDDDIIDDDAIDDDAVDDDAADDDAADDDQTDDDTADDDDDDDNDDEGGCG